MKQCTLVLPSLKISGGTMELLRLADELVIENKQVHLLSMWHSPHEAPHSAHRVTYLSDWKPKVRNVLLQLPTLLWRLGRFRAQAEKSSANWVFSHYATFPLALCVPATERWYFVQDMEWRFVGNRLVSGLLKRTILFFYRRGRLISANAYLTSQLIGYGLNVAVEAPIWADTRYQAPGAGSRDIDVVMVLRKGVHKRLDLYLQVIAQLRKSLPHVSLAAITPQDEIAADVKEQVQYCLLRPDQSSMVAMFARSRLFLHLSEHEGFGLPPLEAMGAGCVPLCRDSGGVRAYMTGALSSQLVPLECTVSEIVNRVLDQLQDSNAERWDQLSTAARATFADGLARSHGRGQQLSKTL